MQINVIKIPRPLRDASHLIFMYLFCMHTVNNSLCMYNRLSKCSEKYTNQISKLTKTMAMATASTTPTTGHRQKCKQRITHSFLDTWIENVTIPWNYSNTHNNLSPNVKIACNTKKKKKKKRQKKTSSKKTLSGRESEREKDTQWKIEFNGKDNTKQINMATLFGLSLSNWIWLTRFTFCTFAKGIPIENQSSLCKCNWSHTYIKLDARTHTAAAEERK